MSIRKYEKHRILTSLCLFISLLVLLAACTGNTPSASGIICGTYTSGAGNFQKILSVDQDNQVYYADQENDRFIHGEVQHSTYKDDIPDQEFTYDGKGFAITIQGELFEFEKINDIPSIIEDVSRYT